jgi:hypothetical protein
VVSFPADFVGSIFDCGPPFGMAPTVTHDPDPNLAALSHRCSPGSADVELKPKSIEGMST